MMSNPYERYCLGLRAIHTVLRNGIDQVIHHAPTVPPENHTDFILFVSATHTMITDHHDHEETIEFPFWEQQGVDSDGSSSIGNEEEAVMSLFTALRQDHVELHGVLDRVKALCDAFRRDHKSFDRQSIITIFTELKSKLFPHLAMEESVMTVDWITARVPDPTRVTQLIHRVVSKAKSSGDGSITLPFFYYNIDDELRKTQWRYMLPWIVLYVVFPFVLAPRHRKSWVFAKYPPTVSS